jgi:hypothetical protein
VADDEDLLWTVAAGGAAIGAATITKKLMGQGWTRWRGKVPGNPATSETTWNEALAWAVVSGVVIGVVRLFAQRGVAALFQRSGRGLPTEAATEPTA